MNYGKLKARLKRIINRKDLDDTLAGDLINSAISDCQRISRLAPNEALLIADVWDGTHNTILIPDNYLELSAIFTDDGVLEVKALPQFLASCKEGSPSVYIKAGANWIIRPTPQPGARIYVQYFGDVDQLREDTDVNVWTKAGFNAVLYTAASLAADVFQMEDVYAQRFQKKADTLMTTILQQDYDDRWAGTHTVSPIVDRGDF